MTELGPEPRQNQLAAEKTTVIKNDRMSANCAFLTTNNLPGAGSHTVDAPPEDYYQEPISLPLQQRSSHQNALLTLLRQKPLKTWVPIFLERFPPRRMLLRVRTVADVCVSSD